MRDAVLDWLLEGDPAIRWQAMRDLTGAGARTVARERAKVAREGWGAELLSRQNADGNWGRGPYTPKWTSTTYTLLLLRDLGLPAGEPGAARGCRVLLDQGFYKDGGINFWQRWGGPSETCITGMVHSILRHFDVEDDRLSAIVDHLRREQMPDGGWNCQRYRGATHGSMHTTILVLESLMGVPGSEPEQEKGREFLLRHRLFRSCRTGRPIKPDFTRLIFPPRWHFNILRALDHFRASGAARDKRLAEAISIIEERRQPDGRWLLPNGYRGEVFFEMEAPGEPSRWNTLRALRVLRWWRGR
jgi:hypothetical protein